MRSMQWQLGILGTISAFAFRHSETILTIKEKILRVTIHVNNSWKIKGRKSKAVTFTPVHFILNS